MAAATVRFTQVAEKAGLPESYTLWVEPEKDKHFASLLRQHRVMTVHQETTGTKADYGLVGYTGDRHANILVFPKSLKRFEGKRIIGIKYDALKVPETETPKEKTRAERTEKSKQKIRLPDKDRKEVQTPPNQIPFPLIEVRREEEPARAKDPAEELAELKRAVKKALHALSHDKPVAAFNLLKAAMEE